MRFVDWEVKVAATKDKKTKMTNLGDQKCKAQYSIEHNPFSVRGSQLNNVGNAMQAIKKSD